MTQVSFAVAVAAIWFLQTWSRCARTTVCQRICALGAKACLEPGRDAEFGVADFLMLLAVRDLRPDDSRDFLRQTN